MVGGAAHPAVMEARETDRTGARLVSRRCDGDKRQETEVLLRLSFPLTPPPFLHPAHGHSWMLARRRGSYPLHGRRRTDTKARRRPAHSIGASEDGGCEILAVTARLAACHIPSLPPLGEQPAASKWQTETRPTSGRDCRNKTARLLSLLMRRRCAWIVGKQFSDRTSHLY